MKMKLFSFIITLFVLIPFFSFSQRGKDGSYTVTASATNVNTYTTLTANATAGATSITVASNALNGANFTGNLAQGDLILIIQMQGASMNIEGTGIYTNPIGYTGDLNWFKNQATIALWGAVTAYNNAGKFEQVEVLGVSGANTISLNCGLQNDYTSAGKVQVIRVPRYVNLSLNAGTSIEPPAWNGSTGGVTAIEVNGNLTFGTGAKISASAKGFRGGSTTLPTNQTGLVGGTGSTPHTNGDGNGNTQIGSSIDDEGGRKGEGIGGYDTEYTALNSAYGRGAPANGGGGGGTQNSGGGGGSNVGTGTYTGKGTPSSVYAASIWNLELANFATTVSPGGGRGGYSLSNANLDASTQKPNISTWLGDIRKENGGYGGHPLAYDATRLFLGGGGGAGDQDSNMGGSGGTGGGLVMVTCYGTISGTGSMEADGAIGQNSNPSGNTSITFGQKKGNDGAGGAGGGGTIYVKNSSAIPVTISLLARGGTGGNHALIVGTGASNPSEAGGPGGGGGGGLVSYTSGTPTVAVTGGSNGVCTASGATSGVSEFPANGATNGSAGMTGSSTIYNLTANNVTICSGNTANPSVTVTGTAPGTLSWYTQQYGGSSFATGTSITTPVLTTTTTYWVGACPGTFRIPVVVTVNPSTTSTFNQVAAICSGATLTLPATSNEGFTGTWSPAVNNTATTTYTFTPTAGQCASTATMTVTVNPSTTPTFTQVSPICSGGSFTLPTTSNNAINGVWSPAINNTATTTYTFTPTAGQCASSTTMTVTVNPIVTPTFTQVAPICSGGSFTLPTTSNNGINGAWSPAINNTATTTYTFTPTAGQCANTTTMTVSVGAPVTPTFNAIAPVCQGGTINLPASSIEGFTGTWSPAVNNNATTTYTFTPTAGQCANTGTLTVTVNPIVNPTFNQVGPICTGGTLTLPSSSIENITGTWSPAPNNTATTSYTFTPTAGQCANNGSMTVVVNNLTTPTFTQVAPICNGGSFTLPATSTNGISGTWSPAINNTTTTTYTFTPTAGQCAATATMTVTVNPIVTPTFTQVAAICSGGSFTLPTTSNNGINGAWSPAINNTATTTYTFTPTAGQCANTATMTVSVTAPVTSTFNAVAPVCQGGTINLPATSIQGFTGTWSPAINNTATTTYTFTPTAGQCANPGTLTVTVNPIVTPTFNQVGPICNGDALTLPSASIQSITGTWSPAPNNTATTSYTFTPTAGQCANNGAMTVVVNNPTTPTFTQVAPICSGGTFTLPTTSNNGITGTWSPAINNTATTTYTFTPAAGQCAVTTTMTVSVGSPVTPTFTQWGPYCQNDIIIQVILPQTSNEGITGTWNPAMVSTAVAGNIVHTFIPDAGQCANSTTMTIVVNPQVPTTFNQVAPICVGGSLTLPGSSLEGITGSWSPAPNNTTTTTYTFTPGAGQCATDATMTVSVGPPATPTFTQVGPVCTGTAFTLPGTSLEGFTGSWSPAINTTATTTYTFTPTAGQCAVNGTMTVTVSSPVTPSFAAVGPVCSGDAFSLPSASIEGITGTWTPAVDNTATTTYTFTPDPGQCANNGSLTVTVNQLPVIDLTGLTITDEHCGQADGAIGGITVSGGSPTYTYEWNNTPSLNTVSINGLAAGNYSLVVTDAQGCTATSSATVGSYAAPVIDGTMIQAVDPTCLSLGSISGLTVNSGSVYTVAWTGSTGTTLDLNNLNAGSYTVTVTDAFGCQDNYGPITLTAPAGANASFTWSPVEPSEGEVVSFTNTSSGAGPIVSTWNINGADSVTTNISEVFDVEGEYTVMLSIVDANGCVDTVAQTIVIFGTLVVPNVITANGDNVNDLFEIKGLKSNTELTIIDRWGIVVFTTDDYKNDWGGKDRSGKDLVDGVYTYIFNTADGKSGHGFVHLVRD